MSVKDLVGLPHHERLQLVKFVSAVIWADLEVRPEEKAFLLSLAVRLGSLQGGNGAYARLVGDAAASRGGGSAPGAATAPPALSRSDRRGGHRRSWDRLEGDGELEAATPAARVTRMRPESGTYVPDGSAPHRHHRAGGLPHHPVRRAAEQASTRRSAVVKTHHDQVHSAFGGRPQDLLRGLARADQGWRAGTALGRRGQSRATSGVQAALGSLESRAFDDVQDGKGALGPMGQLARERRGLFGSGCQADGAEHLSDASG